MAIQLETTTRSSMLDAITTKVGTTCKIRVYSGSKPANCAASITGTLLAELVGNATFAPAASGGVLTLNAITQDSTADNSGTATHFRVWDSAGTTCYIQGDVGTTGSDLNLNSVVISAGAAVSISSFTLTAPGA